jgi:hypothetical protein
MLCHTFLLLYENATGLMYHDVRWCPKNSITFKSTEFYVTQHDNHTVRDHRKFVLSLFQQPVISSYCHVVGWLRAEFGFVNGFIYHLHTRLGSTRHSATPDLHNSQITTSPVKPFPACCAFKSRSLTTACNSWDSTISRAHILFSQPPVQNSTILLTLSLAYNISGRTT